MDEALRKLRGLVGMGTSWGLAWAAIGALIGVVIGIASPAHAILAQPIIDWTLAMGAYGFVSGVGFGGLLAIKERNRTLDELSPARAGWWGLLGACAVPILFTRFFPIGTTPLDLVEAMVVTGGLGSTFAAGWVSIARSAARLPSGDTKQLAD